MAPREGNSGERQPGWAKGPPLCYSETLPRLGISGEFAPTIYLG